MSSPNNPIYVHDSDSESSESEPEPSSEEDDVSEPEDDDAPVAAAAAEADDVLVPDKEKDEAELMEEHQVRFALYKRILFHDVDNNEDVEYEDDDICSSIPGRRSRESWDGYIDRVGQFVVSDELLKELPDVEDRVKAVRDRSDPQRFIGRCCDRVKVLHERLVLRAARRAQESSSDDDHYYGGVAGSSDDDDDDDGEPDPKRPKVGK